MLVKRVTATTESLLDPVAALWQQAEEVVVALIATPNHLLNSEYTQTIWPNIDYGGVPEVRVRALHNGDSIFFRLEWHVAQPATEISDIGVFTDGVGILWPIAGDAPITEMGATDQPVNAWLWRAELGDKPYSVTAVGRGTTERHVDNPLVAKSSLEAGTWRVVMGRPFRVDNPHRRTMELAPGMTPKAGFAVWEGANKERAGIKAYSAAWQEMTIEG
ncbi:MAG: ethylbenzene dehydrogenase-related protein [Dehalococcoidia bacterium]